MKRLACSFVLLALPASAWAAERPVAVSPGSITREMVVDDRCPSFSWGATTQAGAYELAVFTIDAAGEVNAQPVLRQRIPGSALSWTPALEQCLDSGRRYAWSIRTVNEDSVGGWSSPSLFRVPDGPSETDFQQALDVVRRYLAGAATEPANRLPSRRPPVTTTGSSAPSAAASAGGGTRSVTGGAGSVGLLVEAEDTNLVTFGVHGLSTADETGSAGVVGETTSTIGETYGVIGLHPGGAGSAAAFSSLGGADILTGLSDGVEVLKLDGAGNLALASGDLTCANCVDTGDIRANAITGAQILGGTITGSDIGSSTITGGNIATGTVFGSDIADGTLFASDLGTNSVGAAEIASGAVGASEIAAGSVHVSELATFRVASVECNGECTDSTLGQICGTGYTAFAVDCDEVDEDQNGFSCGGDNVCTHGSLQDGLPLSNYCNDEGGWDANVYCMID